jgi:hypothetical protein
MAKCLTGRGEQLLATLRYIIAYSKMPEENLRKLYSGKVPGRNLYLGTPKYKINSSVNKLLCFSNFIKFLYKEGFGDFSGNFIQEEFLVEI